MFTLVTVPYHRPHTTADMPKLAEYDMENEPSKKNNRRKRSASQRSTIADGNDPKRPNHNVSVHEADRDPPPGNSAAMEEAMIEIATKVGDCVTTQSEHSVALNEHSDRISETDKELLALRRKNQRLEKRMDNMDAAFKAGLERVGEVEKTANTNQHMLKNSNIVIEGVPEVEGENCMEKVCTIFKAIENKCHLHDIISAYRIGRKSDEDKYTRPIVAKLMDPLVKTVVMEGKGKLIKHELFSKVFLNDDLPPQMKKERKILRDICKYAHSVGYKNCKASGSKLVIEGRAYRYDTLHLLPQDLQLCNIKTRMVGNGLGFQGEESFLSNFFPATFTIEQLSFSSAEQAYQYFKAKTCRRDECANKILTQSNPKKIKENGDEIPTKAVWEQHKEAFMHSIVYSKFSQNNDLKMRLLDTGDLPMFECTRNRWWGCGLRLDSPEWKTGTYPGLNKLGNILGEVRQALRKSTFPVDAVLKSSSAIIRKITEMDQEIQLRAGAEAPLKDKEALTKPAEGEPALPSNKDGAGKVAINTSDMDVDDDLSSTTDNEDLMGETDIDEESVNISASSKISHKSGKQGKTSVLDVTDDQGKLDISKIRKWTIPKLNTSYRNTDGNRVSERTRSRLFRNTLPSTSGPNIPQPQAQSTPHGLKKNTSLLLQEVRNRLGTSIVDSKNKSPEKEKKKK